MDAQPPARGPTTLGRVTLPPAPPPTGLPVEDVVDDVRAALAHRGTAVLVAPPGAGKTTVVPIRLLAEPWLADQRVVVLEPRRLAARAAARRMAELLGEPVGRTVGYRTRDEQVVSAATRIEVITEGILVRRLQADPTLEGTGLVALDEVHERSLVTDLSLAFVLDARRGVRPDLRVLAMSATIDADRLAAVLGDGGPPAPVVSSTGRLHPVAVRWWPPEPRDRMEAHAARVVGRALAAQPEGDVLVFLPGAAEIDRTARALSGALPATVAVRPLHGSLPVADQDRALAPSAPGERRVVLATDIAESSLTVAGVRIVVDAGLARGPRFDPGTGLTRLETLPASVAAADQRAGRAGRLGPGVAHRLWSEADHARRTPFPAPEISVVDLAGLALEVAAWGADVDDLPFLDRPPARAWAEAQLLLGELGAVDGRGRPTVAGRAMVGLPLHPRLARMVVEGGSGGKGWPAAVLAAVLGERDVFGGRRDERPSDLAERVAAVADDRRHPAANRDAVRTARRRAKEIARRARTGSGTVEPSALGPLVALAYPDRVAQARGGGHFRLRGGGGGWLPDSDHLASSAFLAVADLDPGVGDGRIRTAAALDEADVRSLVGDDATTVTTVAWDPGRADVRRRTEERSGALVLRTTEGRAEPGQATVGVLVDQVLATSGALLPWTDGARALQARLGFLHRADPRRWPNVSDAALLADLDRWLAPHLVSATGVRDLARLDLSRTLRAGLDHRATTDLDRLAPNRLTLGNGRSITVTYDGEAGPQASARLQDLFGTTVQPTVVDGRVPVVLHLLSPAGRPVQITADLPGFWAGTWAVVRKELAGRYPKHDWPTDPATARPRASRPPGSGRSGRR